MKKSNAKTESVKAADVPKLGAKFGGGFMYGRIFVNDDPRIIIRAPFAIGYVEPMPWNDTYKTVKGAMSHCDGLANTRAMADSGSQLAEKILALDGGWHLFSQEEALICAHNQRVIKLPNEEQFRQEWHWTSTQCYHPSASAYAFVQGFGNGTSHWPHWCDDCHGFAVRNLPIIY